MWLFPGVGRAEDYTGLNDVGRVALVKRGEISFVEKTQYAADAGAIGVIVYDNDPETDGGVSMQLEGAALPAIFIGIADGQQLAEAGEGTLTFPDRDPSARGMAGARDCRLLVARPARGFYLRPHAGGAGGKLRRPVDRRPVLRFWRAPPTQRHRSAVRWLSCSASCACRQMHRRSRCPILLRLPQP